jgi:uncharacterized protein (UPF0333 family)
MKLIAPNIEDNPAKCNANIVISIDNVDCIDNGGNIVHPVAVPFSIRVPVVINIILGINNHRLILFNRGKLISVAPIINGIR